ncbi:amyloid-beta A4 precursor protein-binding family A member 3 [Rhinophrynus dorsalis]
MESLHSVLAEMFPGEHLALLDLQDAGFPCPRPVNVTAIAYINKQEGTRDANTWLEGGMNKGLNLSYFKVRTLALSVFFQRRIAMFPDIKVFFFHGVHRVAELQALSCKSPFLTFHKDKLQAQLIAQAIGQAFGLAYQNLLLSEGLEPSVSRSSQREEQLYNADLAHFSNSDNCKEVYIQKQRGEVLGVAVVESGWGSLLPTVVIANLMHGGPAERSGDISIGDHVTNVNGTSLVGLPLSTCQGLIRELKGQSEVILNIVRCPPVITAIIQRPSINHQLGFCVENGVICSLVRGGIAERGGIRVGHRIIEINGQSVVATAHEKIIQTLLDATGEVQIKTMPASTYRLLTGQETPVYL